MVVANGTATALLGGVTLAGGNVDQFTVALDPDTTNEEIVFITDVSGDTFTIARQGAGTSGVSHNGGATVRHVLTSDDLDYFNAGVVTSVITAKGDLIVASSATLVDNLPVGTNDYVLTADSSQALGVKWAQAPTASTDLVLNAQTNTTYTLVIGDKNKLVTLNNASPITLTVPLNSSVQFPTGAQINIQQIGAGQVTVAGAGGVTINGTGTKLRAQWSAATLVKTATDTWTLIGDITT